VIETTKQIYCCACKTEVNARLTDGVEVYPHRNDLADLPFWKCDGCRNFVGCHHKTENYTRPLGVIATQEIKNARMRIHQLLDPIWQSKKMRRQEIYSYLTEKLGWKYHTAKIRSVEEATRVHSLLVQLSLELREQQL